MHDQEKEIKKRAVAERAAQALNEVNVRKMEYEDI